MGELTELAQLRHAVEGLRQEIVRQHDRIRELEDERNRARADRDRLSVELQRVVVDEHLDVPPSDVHDYLQVDARRDGRGEED